MNEDRKKRGLTHSKLLMAVAIGTLFLNSGNVLATQVASDSPLEVTEQLQTQTINGLVAGLPGITVPCGKDSNGLPIGMQIIGDCFKEKTIIRAAYAYEQTREYEHCPLVEA